LAVVGLALLSSGRCNLSCAEKTKMSPVRTVDDLLKKYGGDPGKYQIFVLILLWFAMCGLALNNMANLFIIGTYPHHCKIPENSSKIDYIPLDEQRKFDSCQIFINSSDHDLGVKPCDNGWEYLPPDGEWSIVQEWDLVCDKHYQAAMATSLYFGGVTVGSVVFGYLADMFGRKPIMLVSLIAHILLSFATAFSPSFIVYVIFRFLDGFALQGAFASAYVLSVELLLPHRRTLVAIFAQTLWPTMLCILSLMYYFCKNWQTMQFIYSVPFVITVIYIWLTPESIRWILAMQKVEKAKTEIKRLAKFNKIPIKANIGDEIATVVEEISKNQTQENKRYGLTDLVKTKKMRIISFVSFYSYFAAMFTFYGISFAMAGLKVSLFISFTVTSLMELLVIAIMYFVLKRIGRRTASIICTGICSCVCLLVLILLLTLPEDRTSQLVVAGVAAIGRAALAGYFSSMIIYTSELSPTVLRNLLCGISNFWGRIGSIVSPQVMLLELYVWRPLPFLLCAILMGIASLLTLLLPETKNKPLRDLPEEIESLWHKETKTDHSLNGKRKCRFEIVPLTQKESDEAFK